MNSIVVVRADDGPATLITEYSYLLDAKSNQGLPVDLFSTTDFQVRVKRTQGGHILSTYY